MNNLTPLAGSFVKAMRQFGRDGHTYAPIKDLMDTVCHLPRRCSNLLFDCKHLEIQAMPSAF